MNRRTQVSRHIPLRIPLIPTALALLAVLSQAPAFADAPRSDSSPVVRVGLISSIGKPRSLTIYCKGAFEVFDGDVAIAGAENQQVSFSTKGSNIEVTGAGIAAGSFRGPVRLLPQDDDVVFEIISPQARYRYYRRILEIHGGPALSIVNELPLEDYVRGVIPTEVPASFHPEAQKALTVAIRTYALRSLDRHRSNGYNLCDSIHCQGFAGAAKEAAWVDRLAHGTHGQIIVYQDEPIYALYSSDCGGMTQNNEDAGFGREPWPYLRAVVDNPSGQPSAISYPHPNPLSQAGEGTTLNHQPEDYCAGSPCHTWSKTFTRDELDRIFSRLRSAKIGKFESMEFSDYDCSGRVRTVVIKGDQGEYRMRGSQFRGLLGESVIKSTRMTLSVSPESAYVIQGKGFGHGVGLCAFGANGLAKSREGFTYVDILKHYYTGVEIRTPQGFDGGQD